jgi:hypothetical protein
MNEQQTTSACPSPEAVGKRWGDAPDTVLTPQRREELMTLHEERLRWQSEVGANRNVKQSPLAIATTEGQEWGLIGAEVYFLALYALAGREGNLIKPATRLREEQPDKAPSRRQRAGGVRWTN